MHTRTRMHLHAWPRRKRVLLLQLLPHLTYGSRRWKLQGVILMRRFTNVQPLSCSNELTVG